VISGMSLSELNAAGIARIIPHQGDMSLLDHVLSYDERSIECIALSHKLVSNPLRENGALHAVCGVEYAAQAMALHGALLSKAQNETAPRGGRLAGIRMLELSVMRLDNIEADLLVVAKRVLGDAKNMVYEFTLSAGPAQLIEGKATVILLA
jgi:predicted hotdog family 3-hydroxylacyl-ACP dehydratase